MFDLHTGFQHFFSPSALFSSASAALTAPQDGVYVLDWAPPPPYSLPVELHMELGVDFYMLP